MHTHIHAHIHIYTHLPSLLTHCLFIALFALNIYLISIFIITWSSSAPCAVRGALSLNGVNNHVDPSLCEVRSELGFLQCILEKPFSTIKAYAVVVLAGPACCGGNVFFSYPQILATSSTRVVWVCYLMRTAPPLCLDPILRSSPRTSTVLSVKGYCGSACILVRSSCMSSA